MQSNLKELMNDINRYDHSQVNFYFYTGDSVIHQPVYYTRLRVMDNNTDGIPLRTENGEGYYITNDFNIEKVDGTDSESRVMYRIKDGEVELLSIYLY